MNSSTKQFIVAIGTGIALFACLFGTKLILALSSPSIPAFYRLIGMEITMSLLSVIVARYLFNIPIRNFSFSKKFIRKTAFRYSGYTFILGLIATTFLIVLKLPAIAQLKELNAVQYLVVMITASISEEMLTRGLVQGIVKDTKPMLRMGGNNISAGVLAGAIVFSLIHSSIYISGGSLATCLTIMFFTFFIGIAAGKAKEQSNLGAAILTHLSFNIGGVIAGILINVGFMLVTGHVVGG